MFAVLILVYRYIWAGYVTCLLCVCGFDSRLNALSRKTGHLIVCIASVSPTKNPRVAIVTRASVTYTWESTRTKPHAWDERY